MNSFFRFFAAITIGITFLLLASPQVSAGPLGDGWDKMFPKMNEFIHPQEGSTADEIRRIFYLNLVPTFKYLFMFAAVIMWLIYIAMLIGSTGNEESISEQRNNILYGMAGFLIISLAVSFGDALAPVDNAQDIVNIPETQNLIQKIVAFLQMSITIISIIMIFYAGVNFIRSHGDEEDIGTSKKLFQWGLMGVVIAMLAEPMVNIFYPPDQSVGPEEVNSLASEFGGFLRFFLSFLGIGAVITLIIAGFFYITSFGDEERQEKAKEIIFGTLIGIVIILSAFVLVSTFVPNA